MSKSLYKSLAVLLVSSMILAVPTTKPITNHPSTINQSIIKPKAVTAIPELKTREFAVMGLQSITPNPPAPQTAPEAPKATGSHEDWMRQAGIAQSDWGYVDFIMTRESGWCPTKWQGQRVCPGSYAPTKSLNDGWVGYGLCQSTPGIKMSSIGGDYLNDPVQQLKWCAQHANSSHGGWAGSYAYWLINSNW